MNWLINLPYAALVAIDRWEGRANKRAATAIAWVLGFMVLPFFLLSYVFVWLFEKR